jgi:hypothetical protein
MVDHELLCQRNVAVTNQAVSTCGRGKSRQNRAKDTAHSAEERTSRRSFDYASRDKTAGSSAQEDKIHIYQPFACILFLDTT